MQKLKVLWVEDDIKFGPSIHYRIEDELKEVEITLATPELLTDGKDVWVMVRDWKPNIIMMDHNLEDVKINGANLIVEIRFHDHDTPIIYYSSEMDDRLKKLVEGEHKVYICSRPDVPSELIRLIKEHFC